MPSSFTGNLKLEKQATGENENTWGQVLNRVFDLIDQAISGYHLVTLASTDVTLGLVDGEISDGRNMILRCAGALSQSVNVIIPAEPKIFVVFNDTTGPHTVTIKTLTGIGAVVLQDTIQLVACDGTDCGVIADSVALAQNSVLFDGATQSVFARKAQGLPTDQIFTRAQGTQRVALTPGAAIAIDPSESNCFKVTIGAGASTLSNPSGTAVDGQTIRIVVRQGGTGGGTLAYGSKYRFPGGVVPTITPAANAVDYLAFEYVADLDIWVGNILQGLQ